jgi:hypothetical protein
MKNSEVSAFCWDGHRQQLRFPTVLCTGPRQGVFVYAISQLGRLGDKRAQSSPGMRALATWLTRTRLSSRSVPHQGHACLGFRLPCALTRPRRAACLAPNAHLTPVMGGCAVPWASQMPMNDVGLRLLCRIGLWATPVFCRRQQTQQRKSIIWQHIGLGSRTEFYTAPLVSNLQPMKSCLPIYPSSHQALIR